MTWPAALLAACTTLSLAGGLAGCTGHGSAPAAPATINTHASAHRRLSNTVADVSVGIETEGVTAAAVTRTLADRSTRLITYLKGSGATRLATEEINIETKTHTVRGGPDRIVGYSGTMKVSFRTTPDKSSELIAGVLAQGANTLDGVSFAPSEEDIDNARRELAAEATHIAVAQADAVAKAAGEHVVEVRSIQVDPQNTTVDVPAVSGMYDMAPRAAPKVSVVRPIATAPGERELSINVEVQVDIAR